MSRPQPHRPKHIPQRTCVLCRTTEGKRQLARLVKTPENEVHFDPTGKRNGRGAYVCKNLACVRETTGAMISDKEWQRVFAALERALKITLSAEDRERIMVAMQIKL